LSIGDPAQVEAGISYNWKTLPPMVTALDDVPREAERLNFRRHKNSNRGLSEFTALRHLFAHQVNAEMIEQISGLKTLEVLFLDGIMTADLAPLSRLRNLKRLILRGGTKIGTLDWVGGLTPSLETLYFENFKACDLGPVGGLTQLTAFGFEGSITTAASVETLEPLAALKDLRYLFLANTRVRDRSLTALRGLKQLRQVDCTVRFPDAEFIALRDSLPGLKCSWIDMIEKFGSLRAWNADLRRRFPDA